MQPKGWPQFLFWLLERWNQANLASMTLEQKKITSNRTGVFRKNARIPKTDLC